MVRGWFRGLFQSSKLIPSEFKLVGFVLRNSVRPNPARNNGNRKFDNSLVHTRALTLIQSSPLKSSKFPEGGASSSSRRRQSPGLLALVIHLAEDPPIQLSEASFCNTNFSGLTISLKESLSFWKPVAQTADHTIGSEICATMNLRMKCQ